MTNLIPTIEITSHEIQEAEKAAVTARLRAAELREAAASKQEAMMHLRTLRDTLAGRLVKLQRRDIGTARAYYKAIVAELLDSRQIEVEKPRLLELQNALKSLGELRELEDLLPDIIATVKADLAKADAELLELEK